MCAAIAPAASAIRIGLGVLLLAAIVSRAAGAGGTPPADAEGAVIGFDLCSIDADGLIGPPDGKRALHYEFCIPRGKGFTAEVGAIDPTATFFDGAPGRIGCGPDQVLVIGNTHRPDFALVLQRLADLPYVGRIDQAHFE